MKKILFVFAEPFEFGGQETFAMNLYNNINKNFFSIDFFTPFNCSNEKAKKILNNNKNNLFYFNKNFTSFFRKYYFTNELKKFIKLHNDYDIVHINSGSTYALAQGAKICKKSGIKKVIVHSHSTGILSIKHYIANLLLSNKFKYADGFFACSQEAAEFRFPRRVINRKIYNIVINGIDLEKYRYNENVRKEYREKIGIKESDFVVGNVGRLAIEKNQEFLINVFKEIIKENKNCKLLIVGNGTLKEKILNKVKSEKLEDYFILLSDRTDVNNILQVMDVFVFPSIFEGLGISVIEAQANGLPTICSENIPGDAKISSNFIKLNISDGTEVWKNTVLKYVKFERKDIFRNIKNNKYNIRKSTLSLENIYNNL